MPTVPARIVVVPVDFSADSGRALTTAMTIAEAPEFVHVVHVLVPTDTNVALDPLGDLSEERRRLIVQEHFDALLRETGAAGVKVEILSGDPGLAVADFAAQVGADLIVVPSHGYHGVKRFLLGSVAERIIRHANCSVLVLRRADAE